MRNVATIHLHHITVTFYPGIACVEIKSNLLDLWRGYLNDGGHGPDHVGISDFPIFLNQVIDVLAHKGVHLFVYFGSVFEQGIKRRLFEFKVVWDIGKGHPQHQIHF